MAESRAQFILPKCFKKNLGNDWDLHLIYIHRYTILQLTLHGVKNFIYLIIFFTWQYVLGRLGGPRPGPDRHSLKTSSQIILYKRSARQYIYHYCYYSHRFNFNRTEKCRSKDNVQLCSIIFITRKQGVGNTQLH